MKRFVVAAGIGLKTYFPDEEGHRQVQAVIRDYVMERIELLVPPCVIENFPYYSNP